MRRGTLLPHNRKAAEIGAYLPRVNARPFPIDTSATPYQHALRMIEFIKLTERHPPIVEIQLFGAGGMHPSMAMQYIDASAQGQVPLRCAGVVAYTNLLGSGDFALWLSLSLKRDIRPSAAVLLPVAAGDRRHQISPPAAFKLERRARRDVP